VQLPDPIEWTAVILVRKRRTVGIWVAVGTRICETFPGASTKVRVSSKCQPVYGHMRQEAGFCICPCHRYVLSVLLA